MNAALEAKKQDYAYLPIYFKAIRLLLRVQVLALLPMIKSQKLVLLASGGEISLYFLKTCRPITIVVFLESSHRLVAIAGL